MRIRKAGKVRYNLWYIGREESGAYILEGSEDRALHEAGRMGLPRFKNLFRFHDQQESV
jgi:hypothetical protein